MNFKIFTDYPLWFFLLCIFCGLVYAAAMYLREKKISAAMPGNIVRYLLPALRFLGVSTLAFLLLDPYIRSAFNESEKPVIIIAQDNSASAANELDTTAYKKGLDDLQDALSKNYDVRFYTFGDKLQENAEVHFNESSTDISTPLQDIQNIYQHLNVGAVILATDGIYNKGSNPVYTKNDFNAPYFTIALGDTTPKKDILISRVQHNNIVYLRDKFAVRCEVQADFCPNTSTRLSISEILKDGTQQKGERSVAITSDHFSAENEFILQADAPGIRHYRISASAVEGEYTTDNNTQDIYIEVLDARQKILLLANAPHPDIAAIKESIETNENYEVTVALPADVPADISSYSLVILHNLPSGTNQLKNVQQAIQQFHIPVWFIAGSQTSTALLNTWQNIVQINATGQAPNAVTAVNELSFNLFTPDIAFTATYPKLPPLDAVYGKYNISPASQVLFYQKIGNVTTKYPLLMYSLPGSDKTAVLCGENFFKWRMYDFVLNGNQQATDDIVHKTVQYLSVKNDKKQFRATISKNILNEDERIIIDAELYNDSYELVNTPDASLTITDEKGNAFPFQFTRIQNRYTLDAGFFPEGNYTFTATTDLNGKELTDKGAFSTFRTRLENMQTTANHKILYQLATESNGKLFYPDQLASLPAALEQTASAKPILHEVVKTESIINIKAIFFVLLLLLSAEWFIRKFSGGY